MNVENILKVADAIENHEIEWLGFNMAGFCKPSSDLDPDRSGHGCGTVACIAGWGAAVAGIPRNDLEADFDAEDVASKFMGLRMDQADDLFYAKSHPLFSKYTTWTKISQGEAVAVLRNLAATGEVDWSVAS